MPIKYLVIRSACLPEDEGRDAHVGYYNTLKEAENFVAAQEGQYFSPGDYYITEIKPVGATLELKPVRKAK